MGVLKRNFKFQNRKITGVVSHFASYPRFPWICDIKLQKGKDYLWGKEKNRHRRNSDEF
jgi:hypothetical protein